MDKLLKGRFSRQRRSRGRNNEDQKPMISGPIGFQHLSHIDHVENGRDHGTEVNLYRRALDPQLQKSVRGRQDSIMVRIPDVANELTSELNAEFTNIIARSQSMDDLDNFELVNDSETGQIMRSPTRKVSTRALSFRRQYSQSLHDIASEDCLVYDNDPESHSDMDSSKISSSKSFNSTSDQSCSTFSTPPPSFVPPHSTAHTFNESSPTLQSNGTKSIKCMSINSSMTNSNYKSRDELLTNQNAPIIFERDVQSNSLEDLVHALHESNQSRNKENEPKKVKTKTDEMDAKERAKKANDIIEKFKKLPLSNRSTPRSSQHNSRESLDVLSSRESLNSHSYKDDLLRPVPPPTKPRSSRSGASDEFVPEKPSRIPTEAVVPHAVLPNRVPITEKPLMTSSDEFHKPAPVPRTSKPIPKPRARSQNSRNSKSGEFEQGLEVVEHV